MANDNSIDLIPDDEMVKLTNMMDSPSGYKLMNGMFRRFAPRASINVSAGEVREVANMPGAITLFQNYIHISDKKLANEIGVTDDSFDHEYSWTKADIEAALTTQPIEVLLDALDYAPDAIKESIVDMAVELEIPDVNRRKAIQNATGQDITKMIEVKNAYRNHENDSKAAAETTRRAAQNATPKKKAQTTRRAATKAEDGKEE